MLRRLVWPALGLLLAVGPLTAAEGPPPPPPAPATTDCPRPLLAAERQPGAILRWATMTVRYGEDEPQAPPPEPQQAPASTPAPVAPGS